MEASTVAAPESSTVFFFTLALLFALAIGGAAYMIMERSNTIPYSVSGKWTEGFQGPTRGVSNFPCGQESAEASALADMFSGRSSSTEEGEADLTELKVILSKMCCMKHDLMSVSQVVQATLYLPYNNTHDRENISDTVARCFTKGIPPRDLNITFATWKDRGLFLLARLCTSYKFSPSEVETSRGYFMGCWTDVFSIAKSVCTPPQKIVPGSPRDPKGLAPTKIKDLGTYKGYY
jgi:hypothetical protein